LNYNKKEFLKKKERGKHVAREHYLRAVTHGPGNNKSHVM
jgi:hypothetical protein